MVLSKDLFEEIITTRPFQFQQLAVINLKLTQKFRQLKRTSYDIFKVRHLVINNTTKMTRTQCYMKLKVSFEKKKTKDG